MAKNNNTVGFLLDVVMRKDNESYLMMPGQAFPIERNSDGEICTHLWIYSMMTSNGKLYTNLSSSPISLMELNTSGMYNSALTSKGFGLSVYKINPDCPWVFSKHSTAKIVSNAWHKQLPISKYMDMEHVAMAMDPYSSVWFLPKVYAKLLPGVEPNLNRDIQLWDASCSEYHYFRRTDIPFVLEDYNKAVSKNAAWAESTVCESPEAAKGYYFSALEGVVYKDELYVAFDTPPVKPVCEKLYTREEFNAERTFYGRTYRRYIEVPYVAGDIVLPIDYGRDRVKDITLDTILADAADYDYLDEL